MKVLIDTNVILDFFLLREPHTTNACRLFEMVYKDEIAGFATANSITDVYYVTTKKLGENAAREAIRELLKILGIIAVDGNDCNNALSLPIADFEDALVTVCAGKEDTDYIVSNDNEFTQIDSALATVVSLYDFINSQQ